MISLPPDWVADIGCRVARPGEVIRYLGGSIGVQVTPATELEYLLGKVCKRVKHWSNRLLTLQGQIMLMRHVLQAILVFHLMALFMNMDGFKQLEAVCKEFMWGPGEQGNP